MRLPLAEPARREGISVVICSTCAFTLAASTAATTCSSDIAVPYLAPTLRAGGILRQTQGHVTTGTARLGRERANGAGSGNLCRERLRSHHARDRARRAH